jgi:3-carboxy-cis,cis-muconate cycloisomerase
MHPRPDFDPGFSTVAMREIWSTERRIRRLCDAEAALAAACAEVGLAPETAARAIRSSCDGFAADAVALFEDGWHAGTPLLPLLDGIRRRLEPDAARFLHFGATSQDIIDTAQVLHMRDGLVSLRASLRRIAQGLAALTERHRGDWVLARTLLRPAVPMRFGVRGARWLDPVLGHIEDIAAALPRLAVQLGGPVGDLSPFGDSGDAVVAAFARALGLAAPRMPWHTDRRPMLECASLVERTSGTAATIATDLLLLSQPEIGEVQIATGTSSSIPHKKNAIGAVRAVAAAQACHGIAAIITGAPPHELERAAGSWQAEWFALPLVFHTASAAVESAAKCVDTVTFDAARAAKNVGAMPLPDPAPGDRLVERVLERYRSLPEPLP